MSGGKILPGMPSIHLREDEIQISVNPRWGSMILLEDGDKFLDGAIEVSCYEDGTVSSISLDLSKLDKMKLNIEPKNSKRIKEWMDSFEKPSRSIPE